MLTLSILKANLFLFVILTLGTLTAVAEIIHNSDDVQLIMNNNQLSAAYGKCSFAGDGAAIASSVDVHYEQGEFKKLELSAFGGKCEINLDDFEKDANNPNMIFRDATGCTLSVSVVKRATNPQGFRMLSPDGVNSDNAVLNVQTVPGTCNQFCPQLKKKKKVWQIMMNPRTDKCE